MSDEETARKAFVKNLRKQYGGHPVWVTESPYWRPVLDEGQQDAREKELLRNRTEGAYQKQRYLNPWGIETHEKYVDRDVYYSMTKGYPRRLVVQATGKAREQARYDKRPRHWGQRRVTGNAPLIVKLSELCLDPFNLDEFDQEDKSGREKKGSRKLLMVVMRPLHWIASAILTMLLSWAIQVGVCVQILSTPWTDSNSFEPYGDYENVHWAWPKHAVNTLDQSPTNPKPQTTISKLTIPRFLVVWDKKERRWEVKETIQLRDENTGMLEPYIFLSFSRANYAASDEELRPFFHSVAKEILGYENAGKDPKDHLRAFWVDTDCISRTSSAEYTNGVNTICDAVRCSKRVYILLPSDSSEEKRAWGNRMWTLPEVLLAAEKIRYCVTPSWSTQYRMQEPLPFFLQEVSLTDMYESFWPLHSTSQRASIGKGYDEEHENAISHLIDHYTNRTTLSDLQQFTFAVQALAELTSGSDDVQGYSTPDVAYAAMGLMSYRLVPDETDSAYQAIARLSLVNDTNRLLERLICLCPRPALLPTDTKGKKKDLLFLRNIADKDRYGTHLWDIKPLCDIVGIGNEETPTVILDGCRGIPIRWKNFPRLKYTRGLSGLRPNLQIIVMALGSWFFLVAFNTFGAVAALGFATLVKPFAGSYLKKEGIDPNKSSHGDNALADLSGDKSEQAKNSLERSLSSEYVVYSLLSVAVFFVVGWIISWCSPRVVRQLCSGGQQGVSCHLVGFEGTMSLKEIEKVMYSNYHGRLSYAASTTPFSQTLHYNHIRMGKEPDRKDEEGLQGFWEAERARLGIPDTHTLFTIVDTGNLTVSVIAAERPPVVALICGREGGMLRAVLCSWRFENNCLYREGVMRMRSSMIGSSSPNDWLKVSLASQGDTNEILMA